MNYTQSQLLELVKTFAINLHIPTPEHTSIPQGGAFYSDDPRIKVTTPTPAESPSA